MQQKSVHYTVRLRGSKPMDKCLQQEITIIKDSLREVCSDDTTACNDRAMAWIRVHAKRFREEWQREHQTDVPCERVAAEEEEETSGH